MLFVGPQFGLTLVLRLLLLASPVRAATSVTGNPGCPCLTKLPNVEPYPCDFAWASDGKCIDLVGGESAQMVKFTKYPADYGQSCKVHKEPGLKSCFEVDKDPPVERPASQQQNMCKEQWCFVDPCHCDATDIDQEWWWQEQFPVELYKSKSTCGDTNSYQSTSTKSDKPCTPLSEGVCYYEAGRESVSAKAADPSMPKVVGSKYANSMCKYTDVDNDATEEMCKQFCQLGGTTVGSVPYVLGGTGYGFTLTEMKSFISDPSKTLLTDDDELLEKCMDWSRSLEDLNDKATTFAAATLVFDLYQLQVIAQSDAEIQNLLEALAEQSFIKTLDEARKADKSKVLKEKIIAEAAKIRSVITNKNSEYSDMTEELTHAAKDLDKALSTRLPDMEKFLAQCNKDFLAKGAEGEAILDICATQDKQCLGEGEKDQSTAARRVGCACGINPMAFPVSKTIDGKSSVTGELISKAFMPLTKDNRPTSTSTTEEESEEEDETTEVGDDEEDELLHQAGGMLKEQIEEKIQQKMQEKFEEEKQKAEDKDKDKDAKKTKKKKNTSSRTRRRRRSGTSLRRRRRRGMKKMKGKRSRRFSSTGASRFKAGPKMAGVKTKLKGMAGGKGGSLLAAFQMAQSTVYPEYFETCGLDNDGDGVVDPRRLSLQEPREPEEAQKAAEKASSSDHATSNDRASFRKLKHGDVSNDTRLLSEECSVHVVSSSLNEYTEGLKTYFPAGAETGSKEACTASTRETPVTDELVKEQCANFCSPGFPLIMGTPDWYGFPLKDMNDVCFDQTVLKQDKGKKCEESKNAFQKLSRVTSDFMQKLEVLQSAELLKEGVVGATLDQIKEYRASEEFRDAMLTNTDGSAFYQALTEKKSKAADQYKVEGDIELSAAITSLKKSGEWLQALIGTQLPNIINFVDECNDLFLGVGPGKEYLMDVCAQSNSQACVEKDDSVHVGCCCAYNPMQWMGIEGEMNIRAQSTPGEDGRRLFTHDKIVAVAKAPVNMVADAWTAARPAVTKVYNTLENDIPGGKIVNRLFLDDMKYAYDASYCAMYHFKSDGKHLTTPDSIANLPGGSPPATTSHGLPLHSAQWGYYLLLAVVVGFFN